MTSPGGAGAAIAVHQNQARGGDVERQPEERQQQQGGGKDAEFHRLADIHGDHHHHHRHHDVGDDEDIQHEARQRSDQGDHDAQDGDGNAQFFPVRRYRVWKLLPWRGGGDRSCLLPSYFAPM